MMNSTLTAFVALAALALPAGAPGLALAQDFTMEAASEERPARAEPQAGTMMQAERFERERPAAEQAQERRGGAERGNRDGDGRREGRGDRGGGGGGGGGQEGRGNGGGADRRPEARGDGQLGRDGRLGRDGQPRGEGGRDRGRDGRDREGEWNGRGQEYAASQDGPQRVAPRGSFADSCSGSYVNQGRLYADCRDTRGNVRGTSIQLGRCSSSDIGNDNGLLVCHNVRGDYEGRRGNNGGWDRDRYNGGRNWQGDRYGRRDYGDFENRWSQNNWRRDWGRGRSNDWWRNDRGFRGYSGFRSGFYFAPNYGYYSVPRNYWGQRWHAGDYLPTIFWRYRLDDWRTFGLGFPPPGTQWVAVDNHIYLIDSYDGYIIEVIFDAWRW